MVLQETAPISYAASSPEATIARLRRLLDVNLALTSVGDTGDLLDLIVRTATTVADCEAASILLLDERTGALRFEAATGEAGAMLVGTEVPLYESLSGVTLRENRIVHATDVQTDERHFGGADERTGFVTRAVLCVPMRIEGAAVGVLQGINPCRGSFNRDDAEALLIVAAQAAVAIRNARHEQALQEANAKLAELDRLKTNFVSITSHELRTPITEIQGCGQILLEEVEDELAPYADAVVQAGERMRRVVETLDVMAGMRGELGVHTGRPVCLVGLLSAVMAAHPDRVSAVFPARPVTVEGDARRLHLAFANLLQNALQFSPPGRLVRVEAAVDQGDIRVQIADEGRGLAADDLERIFEAYVQVEDPDRRDHEGLGVGLTVARAILLQHGGRLWAESEGEGRGATFYARLPLAEVAWDAAPQRAA